jgi:spore coat polysaccharide biosynthesis protein SpsF (cytidylyltransferase family)
MSSSRFPGKVLAPLRGRPVLQHVVERCREALADSKLVVLTSDACSDDPVAAYAESCGLTVFRGPLDDVVSRFLACARVHPAENIMRICGDSPFQNPLVLRGAAEAARSLDIDVVTTTQPRTFPRGQNVEVFRACALAALETVPLTPAQREHVGAYFYQHPHRYRIHNLSSADSQLARLSLAIDDLDDLRRLEQMSAHDLAHLTGLASLAVGYC